MKHDQVVRKKYRDAGLIVAICTVLVVLLAGVYLINNGNGRDLSEFSNTNSGSNVDYDLQSSSVLKNVDGGSSTPPAAAEFIVEPAPEYEFQPNVANNVVNTEEHPELIFTLPTDLATFEIELVEAYDIRLYVSIFESGSFFDSLYKRQHNRNLEFYVLKENRNLYDAIYKIESQCGKTLWGDDRATWGPYHISRTYHRDSCEEIAKQYNIPLEPVLKTFDYDKFVKSPRTVYLARENKEDSSVFRVVVDWNEYRVISEILMKFYWQRYGALTDEQKMALHVAGPTGIARMNDSEAIQSYIKKCKKFLTKETSGGNK